MSNTQPVKPLFPSGYMFPSRLQSLPQNEFVDRFLPILDCVIPWIFQLTCQNLFDGVITGIQKTPHRQPDSVCRVCASIIFDHKQIIRVSFATRRLHIDARQPFVCPVGFIKQIGNVLALFQNAAIALLNSTISERKENKQKGRGYYHEDAQNARHKNPTPAPEKQKASTSVQCTGRGYQSFRDSFSFPSLSEPHRSYTQLSHFFMTEQTFAIGGGKCCLRI